MAAAADPALEQDQRQGAFVVAGLLYRGLAQFGDPRFLGARSVAGDGEPHQARGALAHAMLAVEQDAAEDRLRLVVALVGGEDEPRHRALGIALDAIAVQIERSK